MIRLALALLGVGGIIPRVGVTQANPYWYTTIVRGTVVLSIKANDAAGNRIVGVDLYSDAGEGRASRCSTFSEHLPKGALCNGFIRRGSKTARIEITAPGYKKYSLNIPEVTAIRDSVWIDIGSVKLKQSDLPRVEQIIRSVEKDGAFRFELTFHNPLNREYLIRNVIVEAFRPGDGSMCCCPPSAVFAIQPSLQVVAGGKSGKRLRGGYRELVNGANRLYPTKGEIEKSGCDKEEHVTISFDGAVKLPAHDYTAVHIVVPRKVMITRANYCCVGEGTDYDNLGTPSADLIGNGQMNRYGLFRFTFATTLGDELPIEVTWTGK